ARERPAAVPEDRGAPVTQVELEDVDARVRGEGLDGRAALRDRVRLEKRGPLTPEHLREALRRYKRDSVGGAAGFMGFSGEGRENVAGRMGGRKLFR
ncbi:MAG: hypothetical protein INR71_13785, partial [Terriglobus roseus]|nr:hypothetical protein [Terriglobus roseus]